MNSQLQDQHALQRVKDLHEEAAKERLLEPHKLSWRVRSAKALHSLAQRLEGEPSAGCGFASLGSIMPLQSANFYDNEILPPADGS